MTTAESRNTTGNDLPFLVLLIYIFFPSFPSRLAYSQRRFSSHPLTHLLSCISSPFADYIEAERGAGLLRVRRFSHTHTTTHDTGNCKHSEGTNPTSTDTIARKERSLGKSAEMRGARRKEDPKNLDGKLRSHIYMIRAL